MSLRVNRIGERFNKTFFLYFVAHSSRADRHLASQRSFHYLSEEDHVRTRWDSLHFSAGLIPDIRAQFVTVSSALCAYGHPMSASGPETLSRRGHSSHPKLNFSVCLSVISQTTRHNSRITLNSSAAIVNPHSAAIRITVEVT